MRTIRRPVFAVGATLALGLTLVGTVEATSARPADDGAVAAGDDLLNRPAYGRQALRRLGSDLAEAARVNDLATQDLRSILRTDRTAWLDEDGRMYYVEPDAGAEAAPGDHPAAAAHAPVADPFALHSKPDSHRVIYLDFTGHVVTGTAWNDTVGQDPWNVTAYDTDGDPSTFSEAEQAVVSEVWARVADDYAGQDVDVTTEEPSPDEITRDGQADTDYGTRLLIDPTTDYQGQCGCGGVAYVGVFDDASNHAYYQPALAFTEGVGTGAKNLAEVASHEVGHNLGLNHDGTSETGYYPGHGDWAPIMGVGYDRPITQWSSGEYADANNTEDDLAVMADHGAALRADDHGNDPASATPLALGAATTGIVADRTDVDVFSVDVADGTLSITADPAAVEPDLDIKLELLDSAGQVVATADPPSNEAGGMSASLSESVTAGTYLVRVDGTGFGDPLDTGYSDYASLGGFTVVATQ
jgi:hypothetical protein